jgi:uncharacterized membrane protein
MPGFRGVIVAVGAAIDAAGVLIIAAGLLIASARAAARLVRSGAGEYRAYRRDLGRALLLGLEFLVAGDIIRTVAVSPTLEQVVTLGLVVVIRTVLSVSIQVELEGRWPWQGRPAGEAPVA